MADADGVAVGRRAGDALDAEAAAGAGDILDDDRLTERRLHALAENAPDGVRWPPGLVGAICVIGRVG